MSRILLSALFLLAAAGCTNLTDITASGQCGNGVIEPVNEEDCEPGKRLAEGLVCGELAVSARCKYVCGPDNPEALCPTGWGCTRSGFCQAPSGRFDDPFIVQALTAPLSIGDLDGNGFADLVSVQEPTLITAFGDVTSTYSSILRVPVDASPDAPIVTDGDGDGRADVAVFAGNTINIYLGQTDQDLEPIQVPSRLFDFFVFGASMVSMRSGQLREQQTAVLIYDDLDTLTVSHLGANGDDNEIDEYEMARTGGDALATLSKYAVGDLIVSQEPNDPIRDELAVGTFNGESVDILTLDCTFAERRSTYPNDCTLEQGPSILPPRGNRVSADGTFFADLNGDGADDVIFVAQGPSGRQLVAALQSTDDPGVFGETLTLPVEVDGPDGPPGVMPGAQGDFMRPPTWLLGVAQLNDDNYADLITSDGLMMQSDDGDLTFDLVFRTNRRWDAAHVAKMNGDDRIDIVTQTGPTVAVLLGVDGVNFNTYEVSLADNPRYLNVGDFDGDLLPDVIVQIERRLLIGFNDGRGLPDDFVEIIEAEGDLVATVLRTMGDDDAIDDLALVVQGEDMPTHLLELQGSGTRRLTAPLNIDGEIQALGFISTPDGPAGLAVERFENEPLIYRRIDQASILLSLIDTPPALDVNEDCIVQADSDLLIEPIQADDDPTEELVLMETLPNNRMNMEFATDWRPRVAQLDDPTALDCVLLDPVPDTVFGVPDVVRTGDLDRDGHDDIILGLRGLSIDGVITEQFGGGIVVWFGGAEGFSEPKTVGDFETEVENFDGHIALIELDGSRGLEIVLLDKDELSFIDIDPTNRTFGEIEELDLEEVDGREISSIEVVDLDRDGTDDIVLASGEQVTLLFQTPCTALAADDGDCFRWNDDDEVGE